MIKFNRNFRPLSKKKKKKFKAYSKTAENLWYSLVPKDFSMLLQKLLRQHYVVGLMVQLGVLLHPLTFAAIICRSPSRKNSFQLINYKLMPFSQTISLSYSSWFSPSWLFWRFTILGSNYWLFVLSLMLWLQFFVGGNWKCVSTVHLITHALNTVELFSNMPLSWCVLICL